MRVYYQHAFHTIDFPKDTKFFKLTRRYYPNKIFYLNGQKVKMKDLKAVGEVRSRKKNKHHIKNSSKGGQSVESNLISMDICRHNAFHLLFGNKTFKEAGELLLRTHKIKERQKHSPNF
jgi:hypothetical protein